MMTPEQIDRLMLAYFSGKATPQQLSELEDWLREDESHVREFVDLALLDGMVLDAQKNEDAAAVLATLRDAEAHAEPDFSLLSIPAPAPASADPGENSVTLHDLWSAAGYLTAKGLRSKAGVIGSIAAVVALAAALYLTIFGLGTTPNQPEIADDTSDQPVQPADVIRVATLTAQHNAVWASQPDEHLRPGTALASGQRLTLTQGFAEITTARGAIAIIEAPATIEFTHNNNALQLHSGKLVGICETESSKGFLVRTAHLDITDLGTRFGINADADATEVHVFEGKVQAERVDAAPGTEPTLLVANMSARTSADSKAITRIAHDADRFAALLPTTTPLPGTGFGMNAVAIFDMSTDPADPSKLTNRSVHGDSIITHGTIVNAQPAQARRPGGDALGFGRGQGASYVMIEARRDMPAITLAAWVRLDHHENQFSAILNTDGDARVGGLHWQVMDTGLLRVTPDTRLHNIDSRRPLNFDDGGWHHVVVTLDSTTGRVAQYFDGEPVGSGRIKSTGLRIDLGSARIGGSSFRDGQDEGNDPRQFHGDIDELLILNRALGPDEVQSLYEKQQGADR